MDSTEVNFKRVILLILLLLSILTVPVSANTDVPVVFLDGKKLEFKINPILLDGTTLVPLRKIFEALGAKIEWVQSTQTVIAKKKNLVITYTIGALTGKKNNEIINLPLAGQLIEGNTMIPLRFVSEAFGAKVVWEDHSRSILISSQINTKVEVTDVGDGSIIAIKRGDLEDRIAILGFESLDPVLDSSALHYIQQQLSNLPSIWIETETQVRDQRGILLVYAYLQDGTMLNADLLAKGYAKLREPRTRVIRWWDWFQYVQSGAKNEKIGVWMP